MYSLYLYYALYFISLGMSTFAPKFYGEIGLSDSRIGLISAAAALAGLLLQPVWGILADGARYKRNVLILGLAVAGGLCFLVLPATENFVILLIVLTLYSVFLLPANPVGAAISIEHCAALGRPFGPVRMMGTVGYQAGILIAGLVLVSSLRGLYPILGGVLLATAGVCFLLPPIRGYRGKEKKVSFTGLFRDRKILLLLTVCFLAHIGHQFNLAFFTKHLGDLGFDNTLTGIITMLSVALEIPFLLVGEKWMKRLSVWRWMMIGLLAGSLRYGLMTVVKTPVLMVLVQSLSIFHLACFEFIPTVWLGTHVHPELQATGQSLLQMTTFGFARIAGSLAGGYIAEANGIPAAYGMASVLMLGTAAVLFLPMRNTDRKERD